MSSSSAYSNVLLKPPVQQQPAAVPKRDYQDDFSAADFSQTFKDVRDTERSRDETVSKPAVKKAAPVHGREKPLDADREKDAVKYADKSDTKYATSDKKDISGDASTDDTESKKADDSVDPSLNPSNTPATTEKVVPTEWNAALPSLAVNAEKSTEETAVDGEALKSEAAVTGNQTGELITALSSASAGLTTSALATDSSKLAKDETDSDGGNTDLTTLITNTDLQQQAAANAAVDPAAAQAAQEEGISIIGDVVSDKATTKTATADASSFVNAEPEGQATAFQAADTKSVFEKMLQTVARSGSTVQDDKAVVDPAQNNSNNSSSTNALDSLIRFSDAQTPAARSFVVQTAVPTSVGQPQWSQAVGEKVLWLAAQNISSAEINLHPKDLGPMQVKVSVNQEQTTVSFTSHHPVVREVLDQNLNRLRDMFSEQGLNLVNVDVSDKSFSRQQGDAKDQKGQGGANGATPEEETVVAASTIVQQRLVDHYA